MTWPLALIGAGVAAAVRFAGPRVPEERIADEDRALVRESDRAAWRRLRLRTYKSWKKNDDFYRIAAFRKLVAAGASEASARARVREDYPIYYLDPADRDTEGYDGDDGALPILLRHRVERNSRAIKELMADNRGRFRTMNALIRACLREGAV